jgi:hypothetical protein
MLITPITPPCTGIPALCLPELRELCFFFLQTVVVALRYAECLINVEAEMLAVLVMRIWRGCSDSNTMTQ